VDFTTWHSFRRLHLVLSVLVYVQELLLHVFADRVYLIAARVTLEEVSEFNAFLQLLLEEIDLVEE
jgi:hypothetical protein